MAWNASIRSDLLSPHCSVSSIVWRLLTVGRRLVRRRLVRWGVVASGLKRDLLVDDDCGIGRYGGSVDISLGAVGLDLLHQ